MSGVLGVFTSIYGEETGSITLIRYSYGATYIRLYLNTMMSYGWLLAHGWLLATLGMLLGLDVATPLW